MITWTSTKPISKYQSKKKFKRVIRDFNINVYDFVVDLRDIKFPTGSSDFLKWVNGLRIAAGVRDGVIICPNHIMYYLNGELFGSAFHLFIRDRFGIRADGFKPQEWFNQLSKENQLTALFYIDLWS